MDYCEFFRKVERDPKAKAPKMTVREFFALKEHAQNCDECYMRVQRVVAQAPKETFPNPGEN